MVGEYCMGESGFQSRCHPHKAVSSASSLRLLEPPLLCLSYLQGVLCLFCEELLRQWKQRSWSN